MFFKFVKEEKDLFHHVYNNTYILYVQMKIMNPCYCCHRCHLFFSNLIHFRKPDNINPVETNIQVMFTLDFFLNRVS